jgi:hypothetical protein
MNKDDAIKYMVENPGVNKIKDPHDENGYFIYKRGKFLDKVGRDIFLNKYEHKIWFKYNEYRKWMNKFIRNKKTGLVYFLTKENTEFDPINMSEDFEPCDEINEDKS